VLFCSCRDQGAKRSGVATIGSEVSFIEQVGGEQHLCFEPCRLFCENTGPQLRQAPELPLERLRTLCKAAFIWSPVVGCFRLPSRHPGENFPGRVQPGSLSRCERARNLRWLAERSRWRPTRKRPSQLTPTTVNLTVPQNFIRSQIRSHREVGHARRILLSTC
jgi:hypothetical protein